MAGAVYPFTQPPHSPAHHTFTTQPIIMPKRGNDNAQVSKEDYDDEAEEIGDDGRPLGSSGFARADAGQLQKRRIIKVGRRFRQPGATAGAAGATPAPVMTSAAAPAPAAAASSKGNPFGGIALTAAPAPAAPTPAPTAGGGSNPFAKVNLLGAASATPAPTVPTAKPAAFNFGPASNVPKVQPAPKLFPTGQSAAAAAAADPAPAASMTSTANGNIREDIKLNHDYLTHVVEQIKANPSSDLSTACNEYHKMAEAIEKKLGGSSTISGGDQDSGDEEKKVEDSAGSGNGAAAQPAGGFTFGASAAAAPAPAAPFSFGATSSSSTSAPSPAPAPATAAAAFSFGAANTSAPAPAPAAASGGTFGGFSFATAPAPAPDSAAGKAATTAFSFGNPVAAPVPAPAPAAAADDEGGDDNGGFAKEAPAEVQREENKDEDVLFEVRAQYSKHVEIDPEDAPGKKGWKKFAKGPLRLQRHKENGKCRMLMRDSIGKTMLNLPITHGMKFNGKRGQGKASDRGYITFTSAKNESEMELYMLTCKSVDYEKFLTKLEEMARSAPAN